MLYVTGYFVSPPDIWKRVCPGNTSIAAMTRAAQSHHGVRRLRAFDGIMIATRIWLVTLDNYLEAWRCVRTTAPNPTNPAIRSFLTALEHLPVNAFPNP